MFGDLRTRLRLFPVIAITALAVYLFIWPAARPNVFNDPVSLIYSSNLPLAWIMLAIVALISTALTVLICRRRLPDLPILVFAAGLCVLSVRSGHAVRAHWAYGARASYLTFAAETLLLIILFYSVHLLGKFILARLGPSEHTPQHQHRQFSLATALQAFGLALVVAFVAAFLIATTAKTAIAGVKVYTIYSTERGQIVFAALAAGFLSTLAAHQAFRPSRSICCWIALPLLGFIAYLALAWFGPSAGEPLPNNPLGNFLPIDYLGPGTLGAMLGLLLSHKLFRNRAEEQG